MEERLRHAIASAASWAELKQLEQNINSRGACDEEVAVALRRRSTEIAIPFIHERTGLDLSALTPAERKIVDAVGEYVGILREQGRYPGRTLEQLKNRGLLGAAEAAVANRVPTQGFKTLAEANHEELSYERIVLEHPEEFSPRALWFSRRTLGLANRWPNPPSEGKRQQITERLLGWLAARAAEGAGVIAPFTRREHIEAAGYEDLQAGGIATGPAQSRLDFACFQLGLPPLGLTAATPFPAWEYDGKAPWAFPLASMTRAARERRWTPEEFEEILRATRELPEVAPLWKSPDHAQERREWASLFGSTEPGEDAAATPEAAHKAASEEWLRDELILTLDFHMRHRSAPMGAASAEIQELAHTLGAVRAALDEPRPERARDAAAVWRKVDEFRRIDERAARGKAPGPASSPEEAVWIEFGREPARLAEVAAAIRACLDARGAQPGAWPPEPEEQFGEEGRLLSGLHRYRERDATLSRRKKEQVLRDTGKLACEACELDSAKKYGKPGIGLEAHHLEPLHTLATPKAPRLSDVALLCATCHRVLHAHRPWLTVPRLRELLDGQSGN